MKANNINEIKYNYFKFDKCDEIYNISLIYNNSNKQYDIITDCYDNNEIWNIIYISSVFTDNIDYYTQYSLITSKPLLIKSLISSTNPLSIQSSILSKESISIKSSLLPLNQLTIPFSTVSTIITSSQIDTFLASSSISISSSIFQNNNIMYNFSNSESPNSAITINNNEIEEIFNGNKYELVKNLTYIINSIIIGQKYKLKGDDFILSIKPTNTSYLNNSTHVNFTKCENILRKELNISSSRINLK